MVVVKLPCGSCGHVVSGTTPQSVSESYFAHREAVHGQAAPPPMLTALALLARQRAK